VQAYQRIEQQQAWPYFFNGAPQTVAVAIIVEAQSRGCYDRDGDLLNPKTTAATDASYAVPDPVQGILGEENQRWTLGDDRKTTEARGFGGDRNGEIKTKPAFTTLRLTPYDASSFI
jgi:hypothetical protein